ncbi:CPBP family glutamic-type intramembrane protease [Halothermothrix orenii]|uniref:CAAX prenyl protease 2/Lysostaphin resistance protein A-like domain-containing protein n=1 Tax=Halothermothrix orenii (strain H 168 / OCM 544 / DSM 9562) TaxID=373903 RepID=B8D0U8_HALOH|nr:CPBP family glutamic-type intramembrane protease [Halothermothrix orenii]ACL68917.1 hypothetical protein Hore_01550 [Halothermothrix orenii H 168]ACL69012.1 hypothetical protein Hore_02510 [Halothermothrix orenii H 168]
MKERPLYVHKINYKDILIIVGFWYFMAAFGYLTRGLVFPYTPVLTSIFHFLFVISGRLIFLALVIFYLVSLYGVDFRTLGLSTKNLKKEILLGTSLIFSLLFAVLFLVNIPLSYKSLSGSNFNPLYTFDKPEHFINSIFSVIIIYPGTIIIALSEAFLLINIFYRTLLGKLKPFPGLIISSFAYSILLLTSGPTQIIIKFIAAFITIFLYRKTRSLITPSIFLAGYYTFYIIYIYGWEFIKF